MLKHIQTVLYLLRCIHWSSYPKFIFQFRSDKKCSLPLQSCVHMDMALITLQARLKTNIASLTQPSQLLAQQPKCILRTNGSQLFCFFKLLHFTFQDIFGKQRSDINIIILRKCRPEEKVAVVLNKYFFTLWHKFVNWSQSVKIFKGLVPDLRSVLIILVQMHTMNSN